MNTLRKGKQMVKKQEKNIFIKTHTFRKKQKKKKTSS